MKVILKVCRTDSNSLGDCDFLISGEVALFFHNINGVFYVILMRFV